MQIMKKETQTIFIVIVKNLLQSNLTSSSTITKIGAYRSKRKMAVIRDVITADVTR